MSSVALRKLHYFLIDFSGYLILDVISFLLFIVFLYKIYKSQNTDFQKKFLITLFFSLFAFALIFSGFEAYFRYRFDESDSLGFLKVTGKWFKRHVVFNSYYVRDRDFDMNKKKGIVRIGVMGDSIAMGYGIKNVNNRFSNILEKKLRDSGYKIEVYNIGKSGLDTEAEIDTYNELKQLNFDIVIWEYFLNDAQPKEKSTGTKVLVKERTQGKIAMFLSHYSYFFDYLYWRISTRYDKIFVELRNADIAAYHDKANFERHKNDVEKFIQQLQDEKRKIVVIIFPSIRFLPLAKYPSKDVHGTMGNIFKNHGISLIDLLDDLKDKDSTQLVVGEYDYHPNEYVQTIAAQRLYEKILPLVKELQENKIAL